MHIETAYLKIIAEEIVAKTKEQDNSDSPDKYLVNEATRLQQDLTTHLLELDNFPQREAFYFNTLSNLVEICDTLFEETNTITPNVNVLIGLLTEIKKVIPDEISPKLQLPKAFILLQKDPMMERCKIHIGALKEHGMLQFSGPNKTGKYKLTDKGRAYLAAE